MSLIIDVASNIFDTTKISKGTLLYAKHATWPEGKGGFVTAVSETEIVVQYHPGIANVTNHFFLPLSEVVNGEWEIRWSDDLTSVNAYSSEEESQA